MAESKQHGRLEAIWVKRVHRGPMDPARRVTLVIDKGLEGNVDRSRRRQVTLLEREVWESLMTRFQSAIPPIRRRANLLVSGIRMAHTRGRVLKVGSTRLVIGGELTPCERMDEVIPGLQEAMKPNWNGGVFAQVLAGGDIAVDDEIEWESVDTIE